MNDTRSGLLVRGVALLAALALLFAFLSVIHDVLGTVRDPWPLYPLVGVTLLAATVTARVLEERVALALGGAVFVLSLVVYVLALPYDPNVIAMALHNVELLTGQTVLKIRAVDIWALSVTPAPVFVTWFLVVRRRYVAGAVAGGLPVGYLVLTGDAATTATLLAVIAIGALVGFGDLDGRDVSRAATGRVATVLAVMILAPLVVTIVPSGAAAPISITDTGETTTLEESLVGTDGQIDVQAEVDQSPAIRFIVESERASYWKTATFDRYTGDGWVRTGSNTAYGPDELDQPPGETEQVTQRIEANTTISALPAAWRPTQVSDDIADRTLVTDHGDITLDGTLSNGETYEVTSQVPQSDRKRFRSTLDYPDDIESTYTQLPDDTPDRVGEFTAELTADAKNPHEVALTVEQWLKNAREYSLDVDRPDGTVADAFLFEMEAGYCTYYATTMVTMLRTQGIPARLAVGYTPGEEVDEDTYAVRGLNAHAWVEVYYPDVGWLQFDPTPADDREEAEQRALDEEIEQTGIEPTGSAGQSSLDSSTDLGASENASASNTTRSTIPARLREQIFAGDPSSLMAPEGGTNGSQVVSGATGDTTGQADTDRESETLLPVTPPPTQQFALGVVVLLGLVAGVRQSPTVGRIASSIRFRRHRGADPAADIERIHDQLLATLERRHRPRKRGETMRAYLDDIDASWSARQLTDLREKARYNEAATTDDVDEALGLLKTVRRSQSRIPFR
ncbi:transglutaminase TgpA family protein [Halovenus marina]|uniref:transglutaminase TgpA family protein n=1 Tax=Halovenus marina TaxID=3396621 RepID=UPI003F57E082